jgi:hypothetical protein
MMDKRQRRDLVRSYKERTLQQGVFAVHCRAAGAVWVGATRNLDHQQNGIWFMLRNGGHPNRAISDAWRVHGESAFAYEILEQVRDENPQLIPLLLRERAVHWLSTLNAAPVTG